jgi:hypothetical protein
MSNQFSKLFLFIVQGVNKEVLERAEKRLIQVRSK